MPTQTVPSSRVLVVEDDPSLQEALLDELTRAGLDAHGVSSMEAALTWIQRNGAPNLVSTDLGLPVQSGFLLCEQLRSRQDMAQVPIAVVSARIDVHDQARAMEVGADAFIEKPRGLRRYLETVSALLKSPATTDARTMQFVP